MKRTRIKKIGKVGKANIEARKRIAEIAEEKGLNYCELGLSGCLHRMYLAPALKLIERDIMKQIIFLCALTFVLCFGGVWWLSIHYKPEVWRICQNNECVTWSDPGFSISCVVNIDTHEKICGTYQATQIRSFSF